MEKADDLFEKYSKELEADTHVDVTTLRDKLESLANTRSKWIFRLRQCEKNRHKLECVKRDFIADQIKGNPIELSKAKVSKNVESDSRYKSLIDEINDYDTLIKYLEDGCKILKDMGYLMTNLVELIKFEGQ